MARLPVGSRGARLIVRTARPGAAWREAIHEHHGTKDMPLYATGHNQPGHRRDYRGEDTLVTCDWRRAREHLVEDLRDAADATQTWADPHDCDDIPCPTYGDDCPDNLAADLRMAADEAATLRPGTPWRATVAGQAWWLADLGGHCPACGYPLAERSWPELHQRPADGRTCDLELDDEPPHP